MAHRGDRALGGRRRGPDERDLALAGGGARTDMGLSGTCVGHPTPEERAPPLSRNVA
jgi:hypothetical protein